ncbi:MAG: hypothetical protein AAB440_00430 [Patescibacteria group bacterium]
MALLIQIAFLLFIVMVNRLAFIYVVNRKLHLTLTKNPRLTFVYFLFMALVLAALFPQEALRLFDPVSSLTVFFTLFMLFVVNPWVYERMKKLHQTPSRLAHAYPDQQFLLIDTRFLFSKTGDVVFQQTAVGILLLLLYGAGVPLSELVPLFAVIFAIIHLHLYATTRALWATYFTISATVGGFMIPFIILLVPGGVYYAIIIHMLWYVGSGALFGAIEAVERGLKSRKR